MSRYVATALVLVDLQHDFLDRPGLEPAAAAVVESARRWLEAFRSAGRPIAHVHTAWHRHDDQRMTRWKRLGIEMCEAGTPGARPPAVVAATDGELVILKQGYLPSRPGDLVDWVRAAGAARVVLAGTMTHACVSHLTSMLLTAGLEVTFAEGALASDRPQAAAHVLSHWSQRGVVEQSLGSLTPDTHASPAHEDGGPIAAALPTRSRSDWSGLRQRLHEWSERIRAATDTLAEEMARTIGKPMAVGRAEIVSAVESLRDVCERRDRFAWESQQSAGTVARCPLGLVAVLTPWNNPVAIPVGRIAPALAYGNAVVWKPAPAAEPISRRIHAFAVAAGLTSDGFQMVEGGAAAGERIISDPQVDGVTFSGSLPHGRRILAACTERMIPCLLELGGNNGAIVTEDADLDVACSEIARGAFAFAGQRCTATRRVILLPGVADEFLSRLRRELMRWVPNEPLNAACRIGPVKDEAAASRIESLLSRVPAGARVTRDHVDHCLAQGRRFVAPALVEGVPADAEIVQEETFGPVLVAVRAESWPDALRLLNSVRQGLVASLFSTSQERWDMFCSAARAGVLRWNTATDGPVGDLPFGGWGTSGWGGAEHGEADPLFFTRHQTRLTGGITR